MGYEISGRLHAIHEAKQITERFRKREFVVETSDGGRYPQLVIFQLTGDRCDQLDDYNVGDEVQLDFSLRGREWKSPSGDIRYFNSLDVWTVRSARGPNAEVGPVGFDDGAPLPPAPGISDDDIPF